MKKIKVGIIFGGKSGEHEVSVRSAKSIYEALDRNKYEVSLLGIDKQGQWHNVEAKWLPQGTEMKCLPSGETKIIPEESELQVFFPITHGTYGEDGCLQGMLEMLGKPYVGAGVLGSAVGMDKEVQKRLLQHAGIKVADFKVMRSKTEKVKVSKCPVFVKPASMGSAVGVSKVYNKSELKKALELAFQYDTKVLIEEWVDGREIECSVLGDGKPKASLPGEVIPKGHEFYDYEAKYIDENGAELRIPAELDQKHTKAIQKLAIKTFKVLECSGMARVDMFLRPNGELVINEINTLPGFTDISMYPKLWEATGLKYSQLLDRLIDLARERKRRSDGLRRSYNLV